MLGEMSIDAVVAGVEFAADKPFPEWWIAGIQRGVPIVIPVQQFRVFAETLGEMTLGESLGDGRIVEVGLIDKLRRRMKEIFFLPVDGDLRFVFAGAPQALSGFFSRMPSVLPWVWISSFRAISPRRQLPGRCFLPKDHATAERAASMRRRMQAAKMSAYQSSCRRLRPIYAHYRRFLRSRVWSGAADS